MGNFREKRRLGDILVISGVITRAQLDKALTEQKKTKGKKLGEVLVDLDFTNEEEVITALKEQLNTDCIKLSEIRIPEQIINLFTDQTVLEKHLLIPFAFKENNQGILRVAMADPLDIIAIDDLGIITGLKIEPVIAAPGDIRAAIDKYYGNVQNQRMADQYTVEREKIRLLPEELKNNNDQTDVNSSPIVKLVRNIIEQAVRQRASDIHIEALEHVIRIRYRVDGVLNEGYTYQLSLLPAVIARIKIIGGMDIAEKRKPQDGRITMEVDKKEFDIRVSTLPTSNGEKVVMRLSEKKALNRNKKELGLTDKEMEKFNRLLANPHGLILVTGPTGSGKSTTLYTALCELNKSDVNIITVEDPIEANIDGINQVQVNSKAELTFASALRAILRQDPDIIMIGEIRDNETASIAVKASITGHLVVSTLHTGNAASTITRLVDMGIEPYLIGDATVGVIAQRLLRRLCSCKKARSATMEEKRFLKAAINKELIIYEPAGCMNCNETGYYGRIGIYEIMPVTSRLRSIISRRGTSDEINQAALEEGMSTLSNSAAYYVINGITSIAEMQRISLEQQEV